MEEVQRTLSAQDILSTEDLSREFVEVPKWSGGVWVHELSGEEREAWEASCVKITKDNKGNVTREPVMERFRAKLLVRALRDDAGGRLFTDAQVSDLAAKSSAAIEQLYAVAARLSGVGKDDLEELAGNSEDDPSESSS